jgi:hypothetical protein
MPVTAADVQRLIVLRVGDIDPSTGDPPVQGGAGLIASNMPILWSLRADKATIGPRLQELYVQRDALDLIVARLREQVDINTGDPVLGVKLSQKVLMAVEQRKATQDEIDRIERRVAGGETARVGQLVTTAPVTPRDVLSRPWPIIPDPNSPEYSGEPFSRLRWDGV